MQPGFSSAAGVGGAADDAVCGTLREAGLVRQVNRGNSRVATLRKDDLDKHFPGLLGLIRANS